MSSRKQVESFVQKRLTRWETEKNEHIVRAELANLRRGIGKKPGELPQLWGLLFDGFPEELMSRGGEPSREEWAVSGALTLYALHQQGSDGRMHKSGQSLGTAIGSMAAGDDDRLKAVQRRFNAFATAKSMPECLHHLRGLIQLMRSKEIPLDYAKLAGDLYEFQMPDGATKVRLRWGEDFYRNAFRNGEGKEEKNNE